MFICDAAACVKEECAGGRVEDIIHAGGLKWAFARHTALLEAYHRARVREVEACRHPGTTGQITRCFR